MNIKQAFISLPLACVLSLFPTILDSISFPIQAQTLVNPNESEEWRSLQMMVAEYLVQDFRNSGIEMGNDADIEVSPLVTSGDWLLATWYIVSSVNPNGWAGQLLFQKQGDQWVYKGGGNYIQDVNLLMDFGVPRAEAEGLAQGADI
ncbi:hypothetical protein PN462_20210 [Spirulina sp. CS-785/01]|uniref:hypothetical protein n=1 Tax=Spirulina sp. CS-785/01 TaxID=3021716 RepID=UPI0023315A87|nr:hypothetical protein [Spirulina sp. CS-785/01]MDB9315449.1 hypothetical protein [Spirulina sp. CS-785/01]